jgi:hypothetical protein
MSAASSKPDTITATPVASKTPVIGNDICKLTHSIVKKQFDGCNKCVFCKKDQVFMCPERRMKPHITFYMRVLTAKFNHAVREEFRRDPNFCRSVIMIDNVPCLKSANRLSARTTTHVPRRPRHKAGKRRPSRLPRCIQTS